MRWDNWSMRADGGSGGRDVVDPGSWLLAYWMGRYHGFIAADEAVGARCPAARATLAGGSAPSPTPGQRGPKCFEPSCPRILTAMARRP